MKATCGTPYIILKNMEFVLVPKGGIKQVPLTTRFTFSPQRESSFLHLNDTPREWTISIYDSGRMFI